VELVKEGRKDGRKKESKKERKKERKNIKETNRYLFPGENKIRVLLEAVVAALLKI
jgi:hypothetical protein